MACNFLALLKQLLICLFIHFKEGKHSGILAEMYRKFQDLRRSKARLQMRSYLTFILKKLNNV